MDRPHAHYLWHETQFTLASTDDVLIRSMYLIQVRRRCPLDKVAEVGFPDKARHNSKYKPGLKEE